MVTKHSTFSYLSCDYIMRVGGPAGRQRDRQTTFRKRKGKKKQRYRETELTIKIPIKLPGKLNS